MRFLCWFIISFVSIRLLGACGSPATSESPRVRVIWDEDPQHAATISWFTSKSADAIKIHYDTESRTELKDYRWNQLPASEKLVDGRLFSNRTQPFIHHARLQNLEANKTYYFRLQSEKTSSEEFAFRTAPEGDAITLLFGGDSRTDRTSRRKMNALAARMMKEDPSIAALVHGGDYVENGSSWPEWNEWLIDQEELVRDGARLLPLVPTRGNHETDKEFYNQLWNAPGKGHGYYLQKFGGTTLLILNTEESMSGDQLSWMEAKLKEQTAAQWIISNYHRPAFPVVKTPSAARSLWVPLFERYMIDLAFESDGHAYKRTAPIFAESVDAERGVVYAGEGGMGVKQRTPDTSLWYIAQGGTALKAHHLVKLRIDGTSAVLQTYGEDLTLLDEYTLTPKQALRQQQAPHTPDRQQSEEGL